jgi:hypothetical protein
MLILANDGPLYGALERRWRRYIHSKPESIEAYFYKADPNLDVDHRFIDDTLWLRCEEKYPYLWKKLWLALKVFEPRLHEFNFICRPNLSTFIVLDRYLRSLEELPLEKCCAGCVYWHGEQYTSIPFPSGALFTFSVDIAHLILENTIIQDNEGIDDMSLGKVLYNAQISIKDGPRVEFYSASLHDQKFYEISYYTNIFNVRVNHCEFQPNPDRIALDLGVHDKLLGMFYPKLLQLPRTTFFT